MTPHRSWILAALTTLTTLAALAAACAPTAPTGSPASDPSISASAGSGAPSGAPSGPTGAPTGAPTAPAPTAPAPTPGATDALPQAAGLRYACDDGPSFPVDLFDAPATAELAAHPAAEALRAAIADPGPDLDLLPDHGYWLVALADDRAEFIARSGPGEFVDASLVREAGAWRIDGWGGCRPRIALDDRSATTWILDPAGPSPDPTAVEIGALVTEVACTGGQAMGPRLLPPTVVYGESIVGIVFAAQPLPPDGYDCQGNPSTRVVVQLREPLGTRALRDIGVLPYADPQAPMP